MVNPHPEDSTPVIVGCDPSLRKCGIAVAQPRNALEDFILASTVVTTPADASDQERVRIVTAQLKRVLLEWSVEYILVETPTSLYVKKGRSIDALKVLLMLGAVYGAAGYMEVPVHGLTVKDWKGPKSHSKPDSVALSSVIWPRSGKRAPLKDDEAEAQLLCLSAVQPVELRAAFMLMKMQVAPDRVMGTLKREWMYGARQMQALEKRSGQRLKSKGG